ncbi:MarR family transcriptional regulator [Streptomyces tateyamensis]|uniref:MarR family transcriptional regulator n=1 Tax=Streptomyces tateyamensis TaxID=565073 RepID=A0A2V4NLX1_9ACTN|nr:MarR family transcriptional regulator [Streptomyces tateyamensis]PYC87426.1 MarR family transcriptional regulator [Streptomyces tateyamensis]
MENHQLGTEIADALGLLLRRSTRARLYGRLTDGLPVDEFGYPVLSALARAGACSAAELAGEVGLDRTVVTRRATHLETAGLLRREPDPADRRATLLLLTDEGTAVVAELRRRLATLIADSLHDWPPTEAQAFAAGLTRFVADGPFS